MLISLSNKFLFIANLKAASTAIEKALRPYCELALVEARFGKHQSFKEVEERFPWMLGSIDPGELFVFSVMRDPIDVMVSLYNSHMDPKFIEEQDIYTGGVDFDRFLTDWVARNDGQAEPQYRRLLDGEDRIVPNYIITYDKLDHGLRFVGAQIGVDDLVPLGRENESYGRFDRASLTAAQRDRIETHFAGDRGFMNRYGDRLLTDRPVFVPGECAGTIAAPGTLSARDVEIAYELILGRMPENASVVAEHLRRSSTLKELRAALMTSAEHCTQLRREFGNQALRPLEWPKIDIEVDVPSDTLAAMIRHIEQNWALLGENEPYWSVLTNEKFKASEIGSDTEEFYASGKQAVSYFTHAADRAGIDYRNLKRCFELGCGVGRLSVWLAGIFPELIAADISEPHLRLAAQAVERAGLQNVDLRLINTIQTIEALPSFDCFISIIVLQHNPPPVIAFMLQTILRKLNPGGLAYFQIPTYHKGASFRADQYLKAAAVSGKMEVHVLPQAVVWRLAQEANCQVLDVREDGWTGISEGVSNSILLMKRLQAASSVGDGRDHIETEDRL